VQVPHGSSTIINTVSHKQPAVLKMFNVKPLQHFHRCFLHRCPRMASY